MKIGHIELFVADPQISKQFYCDALGFEIVTEQAQGRLVWLALDGREILLRPATAPRNGGAAYGDNGPALVLYTADLPATLARLRDRGHEPCGHDAGCPLFQDPDGHWLQVVNPDAH